MRQAASEFLERIAYGDPPDVDWRPATTDALKHLHPSVEDVDVTIGSALAKRYLAACRRVKEAEQKKHLYENRVRALIGPGRRAVDRGAPGARRRVYDRPAH